MELCVRLDREIADCRQKYEENRQDAYLSVFYRAKLEQLEEFRANVQNGEPTESLLERAKKRLPELKAKRAEELEHPTFDWYGEHYHYEVLDGACAAYETLINLLEQDP